MSARVFRYEPQAAVFGVGLELQASGPAAAVADVDKFMEQIDRNGFAILSA